MPQGGEWALSSQPAAPPAPSGSASCPPACLQSSFQHLQEPQQTPPTGQLRPRLPPAAYRAPAGSEAELVEQLQEEVVRLQEERARVARLRLELEEAAARLEQDKAAFDKRQVACGRGRHMQHNRATLAAAALLPALAGALHDTGPTRLPTRPQLEEAARFEAERGAELRKLQRDRRVLEKQSRAILKMPTKQSKEEVAAVEVRSAQRGGALWCWCSQREWLPEGCPPAHSTSSGPSRRRCWRTSGARGGRARLGTS